MLISLDRDDLHKIVVLNPKGGSGKTTLATNIAGFFAQRGPAPVLVDCDPQGYSMGWLEKRPKNRPKITGIAAYDDMVSEFNTVNVETDPDTGVVIIDLPAGLSRDELFHVTYDANSILIPVLPSAIDVYCASRFVAELLLNAQLDRRDCRLAIVANRIRQNTNSYKMLMRFLTSLEIPLITGLRDSQNYVRAAAYGLSIYDLPPHMTRQDLPQMDLIMNWLDQWRTRRPDVTHGVSEFERLTTPSFVSLPQVRS